MTAKLLGLIGGVLLCGAACTTNVDGSKEVAIGKSTSHLYAATATLWKDPKNIQVCFETGGFAKEKQWTKESFVNTWEKNNPAIHFTGFGTCTSTSKGIRIAVASTEEGPHAKELGQLLDGMPQGMVLDFTFAVDQYYASCLTSEQMRERCIKSIATHEMGHALGFFHEQSRTDTPSSCEYKEVETEPGAKTTGTWDLMSIMNYCYPNRDAVYPTELSPGDIAGIKEMYPPPKVTTPEPSSEDEGGTTKPQSDTVGDDDDDATSSDDEDDDDKSKGDDDDAPKKKTKKKSFGTTPSAGCTAIPGPVDPSNAVWILAVFAQMARRRGQRKLKA